MCTLLEGTETTSLRLTDMVESVKGAHINIARQMPKLVEALLLVAKVSEGSEYSW